MASDHIGNPMSINPKMPMQTSPSDSKNVLTQQCDVLVIGAGLAGLTTALCLPSHLNIIVLAKDELSACSSYYAQGGIAASLSPSDSTANHVRDTLIAGDGLCDAKATEQILSQGRSAVAWLIQQGVPFSLNSDANLSDGTQVHELHLTQEGGHSHRRVVHADDATGKHIMHALYEQISKRDHITVLSQHMALSLITEDKKGDESYAQCAPVAKFDTRQPTKRVLGAMVLSGSKQVFAIQAKSVVLASGGLGQLFKRATAPTVCVGDGIVMAWQAGCRLANLEFVQFHPTGFVHGDSNFLISEAVRGEGGRLINPKTGERFMPRYDDRAELAPRDIVARAIATEMQNHDLNHVYLDISHQSATFIKHHFPSIYAHCLSHHIDITCQPIPVAPTAHYTCGGVMTDAQGQTDVSGLFAVGEVAHTGLHGANRLASNSLLECVVVGQAIAQRLAAELPPNTLMPQREHLTDICVKPSAQARRRIGKHIQPKPVSLEGSVQIHPDYPQLKHLMTKYMGICRTKTGLMQALSSIKEWQNTCPRIEVTHIIAATAGEQLVQNHIQQGDSRTTLSREEALSLWQWQRQLILCELMLKSALERVESRGGHFRDDFPTLDPTAQLGVIAPIQSTVSMVA